MRRLFLFLALLAAGPGWAATYYEDEQALTALRPTLAPTPCYDGVKCPLSLYTAKTMRITVCAVTAGATLSGAGRLSLDTWVDGFAGTGAWTSNYDVDRTIPAGHAGQRCIVWDQTVGVPKGYLRPTANGITVSAGTTVRIRVDLGL